MADLKTVVDFDDMTSEDGRIFESLRSNERTNEKPVENVSVCTTQSETRPFVENANSEPGRRTFQCPLCNDSFHRNEKLFDHIRWQHPQICLLCRKVTEDDDSLMFHLSTHSVKLPSNCKQCLVGFTDLARLQCHMIDHLNNSKAGSSSSRHVNSMTNYERLEGGYYCKKCKKNFGSADAFHTHAFVDHKPYNSKRNTDFVCGYCNASFTTLEQLKVHQSQEHKSSLQKSVRCHVCEEMFRTSREMRVHVRKVHKPSYYKTLSSRLSHDAVNRAKGLIKKKKLENSKNREVKLCGNCGATFKTDETLKRHNLMQHSEGHEKFACQICGKCFWTRSDLRVHIKRHVNRENRRFTCDRCGKVFGSNASLLIHQRIHTGEKPYECPECKKVFRTDSCLNRHRRIHKGLLPHTCEICQKKFRTMSNLRQHLKQRFVHKHIEGFPKPQRNEPQVIHSEIAQQEASVSTALTLQQQQQPQMQQPQQQAINVNNPAARQPALWPVSKSGVFHIDQNQQVTWPTPAHQQVAAAAAAAMQHDYYL